MPLSEREQRILEEIERNLLQEDPGFARHVRRSPRLTEARRARLGVLLFVVGFGTLIGFFISGSVAVGVIAFMSMVAGIVLFAGSARGLWGARDSQHSGIAERVKSTVERWERALRERYKRR